ncbi:uncharacterized protein LOC131638637 [Vicia villosa]|uniref:uncharacterized protein LOC131638637 n=1 Tax=Vicia villosa TaxID=3911 RepID=UPI00273AFD5C|nr:uncharacterized protein LOC131638637 [Vicia villosa]
MTKEITIRDSEGRKITQYVEYEWRPMFCEKCKKLGHQCKEPVKVIEKKWMPKPTKPEIVHEGTSTMPKESAQEATITPQKIDGSYAEEGNDDTWIKVATNRERGKTIYTAPSNRVDCLNGFEALGILNDSLVSDVDPLQDEQGSFMYYLTAVYAHNHLAQRRILWKNIEHIFITIQGPWCILGDFNNVMNAQDRMGGRMVSEAEYKDLHEMLTHTGLSEMHSSGDHFTWSNKHASEPIYSRIDRMLGNTAWFQSTSDKILKCLPPNVSDHALLCFMNNTKRKCKSRRFKFYNCITDLVGFQDVVKQSWNVPILGTAMYILWNKLQRLKPVLTQFSSNISNMSLQLRNARTELNEAQNDLNQNRMDPVGILKVKELTEKVIQLNSFEDSMLRQKSKIEWLTKGDSKSAY